ncbi:hypothetical protein M2302_002213 [Micromonospora sp. A200]|uniref:hypothetical protein n=1 Tax=Micromonospora sp. A200 TaxID=2940568 RepID=UPI0024762CEC|nr:hypothetical protein [Micromonospora sp. A200]MDH6462038.1 hypothetical protein [Micromonospora sp. A200]
MTAGLMKPSQLGSTDRPVEDKQPRDRWDRPLIYVPDKPKLVPYTRCTTFIDVIEDKTNLTKWNKRMVLVGATKAPRLVNEAAVLDPVDDKKKLDKLAEELVTVAGAHVKREKGSHLHDLSEYVDRGEPLPPCTEADLADMAAYKAATVDLTVVDAERLVVVDEIKVAGTPDRVSFYDGPGPGAVCPGMGWPEWICGNLITDLKTGSMEYGELKMAMQLSVYSRGMFYDWKTQTRTPLPDVNQEWGLIINLPAGSAKCEIHWINLSEGWKAVQVAREVREARRKKKILVPFQPGARTPDLAEPGV